MLSWLQFLHCSCPDEDRSPFPDWVFKFWGFFGKNAKSGWQLHAMEHFHVPPPHTHTQCSSWAKMLKAGPFETLSRKTTCTPWFIQKVVSMKERVTVYFVPTTGRKRQRLASKWVWSGISIGVKAGVVLALGFWAQFAGMDQSRNICTGPFASFWNDSEFVPCSFVWYFEKQVLISDRKRCLNSMSHLCGFLPLKKQTQFLFREAYVLYHCGTRTISTGVECTGFPGRGDRDRGSGTAHSCADKTKKFQCSFWQLNSFPIDFMVGNYRRSVSIPRRSGSQRKCYYRTKWMRRIAPGSVGGRGPAIRNRQALFALLLSWPHCFPFVQKAFWNREKKTNTINFRAKSFCICIGRTPLG